MTIDESAFTRFLYWIKERWSIYQYRMQGYDKPWTEDRILQENFFTMPYRELDKTTLWFRTNVREPLWGDPAVLFATICFRWFNFIPTGEILLGSASNKFQPPPSTGNTRQNGPALSDTAYANLLKGWIPHEAKRRLRGRSQIFTGAFNISNSGSSKAKLDRVIDDYVNPVWRARETLLERILDAPVAPTLQRTHSILTSYPGLGGSGFMAYEIVCDLRFTYILQNAPDVMTWTNMGPGAKRGFNRLMNVSLKNTMPRDYMKHMCTILQRLNQELPVSQHNAFEVSEPVHSRLMPRFEMREVEHSLCEFDKYERIRTNEGRSKRKFNGAS